MRRGTTETKVVTISGTLNFDNVAKAVMTIGQGLTRIHQEITFDSEGKGRCTFTPEQTLMLKMGTCREQGEVLLYVKTL